MSEDGQGHGPTNDNGPAYVVGATIEALTRLVAAHQADNAILAGLLMIGLWRLDEDSPRVSMEAVGLHLEGDIHWLSGDKIAKLVEMAGTHIALGQFEAEQGEPGEAPAGP